MGLAARRRRRAEQEVRTKLFVATRRPRIATYSGRAALAQLGPHRRDPDRGRSRAQPDAGDVGARGRSSGARLQADPELAHFRAKYHEELKVAFEAALATLDVRQRNLLRHHFVDGLTVEAIGALYGVHKTTAFRWVEAARTALSKRTRAGFQQRVKALPSELESIVRVCRATIDLSLSRVLAASNSVRGVAVDGLAVVATEVAAVSRMRAVEQPPRAAGTERDVGVGVAPGEALGRRVAGDALVVLAHRLPLDLSFLALPPAFWPETLAAEPFDRRPWSCCHRCRRRRGRGTRSESKRGSWSS